MTGVIAGPLGHQGEIVQLGLDIGQVVKIAARIPKISATVIDKEPSQFPVRH